MNTFIPLATDLMGTKIKTPENEEIGVVQNIMIDPQNGTIIFVVLCYANFVGKVHRYFAIPRELLSVKYGQNNSTYLEVNKRQLRDAKPIIPGGESVNYIGNNAQRIYELVPEKSRIAKSFA